jgi:hypothetical protein
MVPRVPTSEADLVSRNLEAKSFSINTGSEIHTDGRHRVAVPILTLAKDAMESGVGHDVEPVRPPGGPDLVVVRGPYRPEQLLGHVNRLGR